MARRPRCKRKPSAPSPTPAAAGCCSRRAARCRPACAISTWWRSEKRSPLEATCRRSRGDRALGARHGCSPAFLSRPLRSRGVFATGPAEQFLRAGAGADGVPEMIVLVPHPLSATEFPREKAKRVLHHLAFRIEETEYEPLQDRFAAEGLQVQIGR